MEKRKSSPPRPRVDIASMEADLAFFEARLSLADHAPDTSYQRAQVKTYQTLGRLIGESLSSMRASRPSRPGAKNAAA